MSATESKHSPKASTGVEGLDAILSGGFPRDGMFLIQGGPGTGKTTLGLQFLIEGHREGEKVLYITLTQAERKLEQVAASHGWSLEGIEIEEVTAEEAAEVSGIQQTILHTAEVELGETIDAFRAAIKRAEPDRVVLDSIAVIRHLAGSTLYYNRQVLALREFFMKHPATVLFLDNESTSGSETVRDQLDGVIHLDQSHIEYGDVRRHIRVVKMRGMAFHGGNHNFKIRTGGLDVYSQFAPAHNEGHAEWTKLMSGIDELDALLGGGLLEGTACLLVGPTGTGKTSLATLYAHTATKREEHAAVYLFGERLETFYMRSEGLGMDVRPSVEQGRMVLRQIDTGRLSPGEFAQRVRKDVEEEDTKIVVLDSLTGYFHAMPQEQHLTTRMHELLTYLSEQGVLTILIVGQHGLLETTTQAPLDVSYMADTVVLLRHFEARGDVRKAISVLKKRHGPHEKTIRELQISEDGLQVGEVITEFSGVLSDNPTFEGQKEKLMKKE